MNKLHGVASSRVIRTVSAVGELNLPFTVVSDVPLFESLANCWSLPAALEACGASGGSV